MLSRFLVLIIVANEGTLVRSFSSRFASHIVFAHDGYHRRNRFGVLDDSNLYALNELSDRTNVGTGISSCMGGVTAFEQWWDENVEGSPILKHASFDDGNLRGLQQIDGSDQGQGEAVVVPRKVVLSAPLNSGDGLEWDVNLAVQLLKECKIGQDSRVRGYCTLLNEGSQFSSDAPPRPTAAHAVRHWSPSQKELLSSSPSGVKLLRLEREQTEKWNAKYDSCPPSVQQMFSRESFLWALEVVHSRAFTGDFGPLASVGPVPVVATGVAQVAAAAFGVNTLLDVPQDNTDVIAAACAIVALLPLVIVLAMSSSSNVDAVLLPMIDSANHLEEADSCIEYDPFKDGFRLTLGEKCFGDNGQIFISYGKNKSDAELLLNYGFLPGVQVRSCGSAKEIDDYRTALATEFLKKN